jgi:hypothetical protein
MIAFYAESRGYDITFPFFNISKTLLPATEVERSVQLRSCLQALRFTLYVNCQHLIIPGKKIIHATEGFFRVQFVIYQRRSAALCQ